MGEPGLWPRLKVDNLEAFSTSRLAAAEPGFLLNVLLTDNFSSSLATKSSIYVSKCYWVHQDRILKR